MGAVRRKGELKDIRRIESRFLQLLNLLSDFHHLFPSLSLSPSITMGDEEAPVEEYKLSDSLVADFKDAFERIDKEGTGEIPTSELGAVMRMLGHQLKPDQLQECFEEQKDEGSRGGEGSQRGFQNPRQGRKGHHRRPGVEGRHDGLIDQRTSPRSLSMRRSGLLRDASERHRRGRRALALSSRRLF